MFAAKCPTVLEACLTSILFTTKRKTGHCLPQYVYEVGSVMLTSDIDSCADMSATSLVKAQMKWIDCYTYKLDSVVKLMQIKCGSRVDMS